VGKLLAIINGDADEAGKAELTEPQRTQFMHA
jgi:hypothetical protein